MVGTWVAAALGYGLGSVPFGLLLSRAAGLGDIRKIGSGNIGATNVLRTGNKTVAALTLACDVAKGFVPVAVAQWAFGSEAAVVAGFAAILGHIFPVWLTFKGGKGVATALGVLLGWSWPLALLTALVWVLVFAWRRISSLAALCAAAAAVPIAWYLSPAPMDTATTSWDLALWPAVAVLAVIVFLTHRANIARLLAGTEPRSSFSKSA